MLCTDQNGWCTGPIQAPLLQIPCARSAQGAAEVSLQVKHDCQQQQAAAGPEQYYIMDNPSPAYVGPNKGSTTRPQPCQSLLKAFDTVTFPSQANRRQVSTVPVHHFNCQQSAAVAIAFWETAVSSTAISACCVPFPPSVLLLWQHEEPAGANAAGQSCSPPPPLPPPSLYFGLPCAALCAVDGAKQQWLEEGLTLCASPTQPQSCGSMACSMRWSHPATVQRCTGTGTGRLPGPCRCRAATWGLPHPAHSQQ